MSRLPATLLAYSLLTFSACHPTRSPGAAEENLGIISVRVVNRNRADVEVSVYHDGIRSRLGLAVASSTTDFTLPIRTLGAGREYRLIGNPLGMHIGITTEMLHAQNGDEVTWSLEDSFARSTVVVH
jgi:hypothetical protein